MSQKQSLLADQLNAATSVVRGQTAYLIIDCSSGAVYEHQANQKFRSASLIKIPILWAYLERVQNGAIDPASSIRLTSEVIVGGTGILKKREPGSLVTWEEVARLMIIESDNVATNLLINLLGFETINQTIRQLELASTVLRRKMQDFEAVAKGLENITTARDVAKLLMRIALRRSQDSLERYAFNHLLAQNLNQKLPKLIPSHVKCAHKTGDFPKLEHDAGILTDGIKDVVVVALSDNLIDNLEGVKFCQEVGKLAAERLFCEQS